MNDFWSYSTSGGWSQITPKSSSNPLGRQQALGTWDSKDNLLILTGGWEDGQGVPFWGFWVYDPKQNAWGLLLPSLSHTSDPHIPGRTDAAMIWDAAGSTHLPLRRRRQRQIRQQPERPVDDYILRL